jgi:hypothetical protein
MGPWLRVQGSNPQRMNVVGGETVGGGRAMNGEKTGLEDLAVEKQKKREVGMSRRSEDSRADCGGWGGVV